MPSYKLTYFPLKALAEPIRFLFHYAGIEFDDYRFERENWPNLKPTMPFGQVPILEVDGKRINQSTSICRYLAKQFNLAGKDDWENLEIDAMVDNIHDLRMKIAAFHYETHAEAKAQKQVVMNEMIPFFVTRLDEQVKKNGGYFIGGKLTWVDLFFVAILDYLNFMAKQNIIEKAENLTALQKKILEIPSIKDYVEKRPKSDM